ncbi:hypothetical protein [Aquisphaera insulae]|uniref:hypothetical protein n=1 Tax=Aquisphaera insulae TaxID=2712864 RepID=UPI0013EB28AF|nr:hypothetical protein [Aquisphaera insulae]
MSLASVHAHPHRRLLLILVGLALIGGTILRLAWLSEMEWKDDESWTFEHAQQIGSGAAWYWTGMPASVGIPNPGLSVWIFSLPAIRLHDPVSMTASVAVLNIAALAAFMGLALTRIGRDQRLTWLLGTVLLCVNPVAVMASRKLWAQDVLTPCTALVILAFLSRRSRWGSFAWGLSGTLLGQIHLSGFFFQAALVLWSLLDSRGRDDVESDAAPQSPPQPGPCWRAFACGTALGALPMIPWVYQLLFNKQGQAATNPREPVTLALRLQMIRRLFGFLFLNPLGLTPTYVYFRTDFWSFLRGPVILGRATCLVLAAHLAIAGLFGLGLLNRLARWFEREKGAGAAPGLRDRLSLLWSNRAEERWLPSAVVVIYTLILLLIIPMAYYHYLIICSWFLSIALVQFLRTSFPRRGLAVVLAMGLLQFLLSLGLLWHIHEHGSTADEYGSPYRLQAEDPGGRRSASNPSLHPEWPLANGLALLAGAEVDLRQIGSRPILV